MKKIVAFVLAIMFIFMVAINVCAEHNHNYKTVYTRVINPDLVKIIYVKKYIGTEQVMIPYKVHYAVSLLYQECVSCPATRAIQIMEEISRSML